MQGVCLNIDQILCLLKLTKVQDLLAMSIAAAVILAVLTQLAVGWLTAAARSKLQAGPGKTLPQAPRENFCNF